MNQWISLLIDFPFKLVTPSSIIITTSGLLREDQPKLFGQLSRCALDIDYVLFIKVFTTKE